MEKVHGESVLMFFKSQNFAICTWNTHNLFYQIEWTQREPSRTSMWIIQYKPKLILLLVLSAKKGLLSVWLLLFMRVFYLRGRTTSCPYFGEYRFDELYDMGYREPFFSPTTSNIWMCLTREVIPIKSGIFIHIRYLQNVFKA